MPNLNAQFHWGNAMVSVYHLSLVFLRKTLALYTYCVIVHGVIKNSRLFVLQRDWHQAGTYRDP